MPTLRFDLFWSFRSPYSYLATGRIVQMQRAYNLEVDVRPVYPLAVRDKDFFKRVNPLWVTYLIIDTVRLAEMNGIPYRWPSPDPIVQDYETKEVADEQPYIERLTRLGAAAAERGKGLEFIDEVSQVIWSGEVERWNEGEHLARAAQRAGLDLTELDEAVASDPDRHERIIKGNQEALHAAGHWGVPTMVFNGEPFFGQDRLDVLIWRLKRSGLEPR